MRKRERLERALADEPVDRVPAALWRHFPGDDQRFADLARSIIDFQHDYNWDFVRAMPSRSFLVNDYGLSDAWRGDARGIREIDKRIVRRSLDWTELRPLSPERGALAQQLECLRMVDKALQADDTPLLPTIYSPLAQAAQLAGREKMLRDLRLRPDRLRSGLTQLTESTMRFIAGLAKLDSVAGIFLVAEFASYDIMSEAEYAAVALPQIRNILAALPSHWWLNIAQVNGAAPMLGLIDALPVQALNWDARAAGSGLEAVRSACSSATCGGLSDDDLLLGTPSLLRSAIQQAFRQCKSRRLIVSGSGCGFITMPLSNIRALRSAVESLA
ncbi:MAG: hypothetical protein OXE95_12050 [Chloroflexi bacterium]|nr:hypothetical protein [Chloroflexota bacterium]MCY4248293.1 hypothetical protein [Chloroflexota bacterium]